MYNFKNDSASARCAAKFIRISPKSPVRTKCRRGTLCAMLTRPCVASSSCRRALWWSAGSCSVTLASWREDPVLSWRCAPESGPKPSWRWVDSSACAVHRQEASGLPPGPPSSSDVATLRGTTTDAIGINTSCADLIWTKWCTEYRIISALSRVKRCFSVLSGPTSITFWSVPCTSQWTRCLIPSLPNSSHPDPGRWSHQDLLIGLFLYRVFRSKPPEAEWFDCCVQVVAAVTWKRTDSLFFVPVWIIILAVLAGLLLLALLIYLLYKVKSLNVSASDRWSQFWPRVFRCFYESLYLNLPKKRT